MRTLIVAPFSPYPLVFGGAIRLYHLIKMFASFSDVTLIAYESWSDDEDVVGHLKSICKEVELFDKAPLAIRKKVYLQARALVSSRSFQYHSHYSTHFQRRLNRLLQEQRFNYIVAEQSHMGYFEYNQPGALKILDLPNIEFELLRRRVEVQTKLARRIAMDLDARKFEREEMELYRRFELLFTASERERDQLRRLLPGKRIESLPNSIDPDRFALRSHLPTTNEITFIGATHVDANSDGLRYFMAEIFPLVEQQVPDIHFSIIGGNPPPDIRAFGERPNVEVTGYVPDVRPAMEAAKLLVVPLRSGGGTRLKILEGLSLGVPTVSTSIGAEGLDLIDGEHLMIADTPQAFAEKIVTLIKNPKLQRHLSLSGRRIVEERFSWQAVGRQLQTFLQNHAGRQGQNQAAPRLITNP